MIALYSLATLALIVWGGVGWVLKVDADKHRLDACQAARLWRKRAEAKELDRFFAADEAKNWQALAIEQNRRIEALEAALAEVSK